jgi:transposase
MPKAYSRDLRERVITAVKTGASRREAAERFEVSVASAVKWLQRWYQQRSARTAQATDQNQPQFALAFSRPTQHHSQKKPCKQPA